MKFHFFRHRAAVLVAAAFVGVAAAPAQATVIAMTDIDGAGPGVAAAGSFTIDIFEDLATLTAGSGLNIRSVSTTGAGSGIVGVFIFDPNGAFTILGTIQGGTNFSFPAADVLFPYTDTLSVASTLGATANGLTDADIINVGDNYNIFGTLNISGPDLLAAIVAGTFNFGFRVMFADGSFDSLAANIDQFRVTSEVPLPAALPLFLAGLAAVGAASRRRKRAA